jgi:hypothetical protein
MSAILSAVKADSAAASVQTGLAEGADAFYRMPVLMSVVAGSLLQIVGVYWDIAWHIEVGRDKLFSAPHIAILAGIGFVGVSAILALSYGERNPAIKRSATLVLLGVAIQVVALAVVDDWWHRVYGIDATLWSPPHLLTLFAASVALFGFLLGAVYGSASVPRSKSIAVLGIGLANLLILTNVALAEYDFSFPQFRLAYQPVVLGATTIFCLVLAKRIVRRSATATIVAGAFMLLRLAMWPVLGALGRSSRPYFPAAIVAGIVIDLATMRGGSPSDGKKSETVHVAVTSLVATVAFLLAETLFASALEDAFGLPPSPYGMHSFVTGGIPAIVAGTVAGLAGFRLASLVQSVSKETAIW